jgi:hypothetical protein
MAVTSISVKYGSDTYTFKSKDGNHYWFISECPKPSFHRTVGKIADFETRAALYKVALSSGFTDSDFESVKTFVPNKETRGSTKPYKAPKSRMVSERKTPARKSTLSNSIKLF